MIKDFENSKIPNLFHLLNEKGINQAELSKKIEVSKGNITDWKKGKSCPSAGVLKLIADTLNTTTEYLKGEDNTAEKINDHENHYSEKEKRIISAYRNNPRIKKIIDSVLGLEEDSTDDSDLKSALESPIVLENIHN